MGILSGGGPGYAVLRKYMCKPRGTDVSFETKPYILHMLEEGPAKKATVTKNEALSYYKEMSMIRRMETTAANLYRKKLINGFCHLCNGQEAVAVGFKAAMRPDDCVITSYRAHGWTYIMGVPVVKVLGELMGKTVGCSRGKGGSMHMYARNFYGGNGIVGAQVPLGLGVSMALKYQGKKGTCFAIYGDGAANQGQVFESFNIAKLWNIPCVFVCENNQYGMGTKVSRSSALTQFYKRGHYIPGFLMDAMDILTIREAIKFAINYVTTNNGPLVIEASTYRYYGHSMSDPGTSYRNREEINEVRQKRDPISKFKEKIVSKKLVTEKELSDIEAEVKSHVGDAVKKLEAMGPPALEELTADIYGKNLEKEIRNIDPFHGLKHISVGSRLV